MALSKSIWLKTLITERHEAYNPPTYGPHHNIYHTGLQLNIASPGIPGTLGSLKEHLGMAGGAHTDEDDDPIVPTVMTSASKLQKGAHPGLFHILDLGIYVQLDMTVSVLFSGRHKHGGTAPYIPPHLEAKNTDIRITCISYPNQPSLDRCGPTAVASVRFNNANLTPIANTLFSPALLDSGSLENSSYPSSSRLTFARQGRFCMDAKSLQLFLEREMLNMKIAVLAQAGFSIHQPHLATSIGQYADGSLMPGVRFGPGGDPTQREAFERRLLVARLLMASTIPLMIDTRVQTRPVKGLPTTLSSALAAELAVILGGSWSADVGDPAAILRLEELASSTYKSATKFEECFLTCLIIADPVNPSLQSNDTPPTTTVDQVNLTSLAESSHSGVPASTLR